MIKTNLAVLMAERGLKISDVYEATGISKTTLMAISENTGKGVQYDTVDKLCNYLEVTPSDFFVYAPYIFDVSSSVFDKGVGGSEYPYNLFCNVKKGESELNFDIGIYFADGTCPDISEDLLDDYYKDISKYDLIIIFLSQNEKTSFLQFYNSLQTQFKTTVKQKLFSSVISQINLGHVNGINSIVKDKKSINVLFAVRDEMYTAHDYSNVYVEKTLKVKDEKIMFK